MKNINFLQPKYVIPLIILPFLFGFFYVYKTYEKERIEETPKIVLQTTEGINTTIPEPDLSKKQNKNKFAAFKEQFKDKRDYSAIQKIEEDGISTNIQETKYTEKEIRYLDSINREIELKKALSNKIINAAKANNTKNIKKNNIKKNKKTKSYENDEMKMFKEQMRYIDSLSDPQKYIKASNSKNKQIKLKEKIKITKEQVVEEPVEVTKKDNSNLGYFNTVKSNKEEVYIKALLDEGLKVYRGSRVRIRIMDDIFIDGNLLKKGNYLYGIVTGFRTQRAKIQIKSILLDQQIIPVDLIIYDNDGIEGLYIPASKFREFTKELGSSVAGNSFNIEDNPQNSAEIMYETISKTIASSSKAIRKSLQKNKAKLKYNTVVYLVNKQNK